MLSAKRLILLLILLWPGLDVKAAGLLCSPAQPAPGDRILLSVDEYLEPGANASWEYQLQGRQQWQMIADTDGFPSFVVEQPGALLIRCKIVRADGAVKRLQRSVKVDSPAVRRPVARSLHATADRRAAKQRALDARLRSDYGIAEQVSDALHKYRVYEDDQQFLQHVAEVARVYREAANRIDRPSEVGGQPQVAIKDGIRSLKNEIAVFENGLDEGSLAKQAWSSFFAAVDQMYVENWRRHPDDLPQPAAHAAFLKEVAQGLTTERDQAQSFIENYATYQSYVDRYNADTSVNDRRDDDCRRILFGH